MTTKKFRPLSLMIKNPKLSSLLESDFFRTKILESRVNFGDVVEIDCRGAGDLMSILMDIRPWRKGPFCINGIFVDSEWQSFIKWNALKDKVDMHQKDIADVGCNNGYYMFRMLEHDTRSITGFDPSELFYTQFCVLNHLVQSKIDYKLLGVEDLLGFKKAFDVIFCLGVIYHRSDPISALKALKAGLKNEQSEIILDTLIYNSKLDVALSPISYAKMKNVYFIPSISALKNWCASAGLVISELLHLSVTSGNEQRKTEWILGQSLRDFVEDDSEVGLDFVDTELVLRDGFVNINLGQSIEGYHRPLRGYFRIRIAND